MLCRFLLYESSWICVFFSNSTERPPGAMLTNQSDNRAPGSQAGTTRGGTMPGMPTPRVFQQGHSGAGQGGCGCRGNGNVQSSCSWRKNAFERSLCPCPWLQGPAHDCVWPRHLRPMQGGQGRPAAIRTGPARLDPKPRPNSLLRAL